MTGGGSPGYDPLASAGGDTDAPAEPRLRMASPVTGEEEVEAVREVLGSGILTNGPATRRFEQKMAERHGTAHAVALANGTVALAAMHLAAGIGPGDEVILPSLSFIGTATSVTHVGATPVFADIEPDTFNLDPDDVARRITPRTRAIVPVHYAGQSASMDRFRDLADEAGLVLLEDAAQAHGATFRDRPVGSWGDAAMFSFTPTKNVTTGEGAVVTTDDADLAQRMRLLRNHGMSRQYHHDVLGFNWRLSEVQAAIGCVQLDRLDGILEIKRRNADRLADLLADVDPVDVPFRPDDRDHPYMLYTLRTTPEVRERIRGGLDRAGIEHRLYFPPIHRQPIYRDVATLDLPVTDETHRRIVSIPFHSRIGDEDLSLLAKVLSDAVGG